jgi:hypothetical protein
VSETRVLDPLIAQVAAEHEATTRRNGQRDTVAETGPRQLRYFAAGESLDPLPPVEWVVKDIIRAGSLSALVGGAKIGKSFACLDLGVKVAMGRDWLGREVKQCPVIYLDEENGEILMRQRLAMVLRGHGIEDRDIPFYVLPMPRLNFGAVSDRNLLTDFILERGAGLIFVDSFIDALTIANAKESVSEDQMRVLLALRHIAENTGAAVGIIHHENRSGTYRGSSALPGAVDVMLSAKGKPGEGRIDFEMELSRSTELQKFSALANFGPDTFTLSPAETVKDTAPHFSKSEDYVMRYLQQHGQAKIGDIMAGADTCTEGAARRAVYSLASLGRVVRVNPGKRGEEAIYERTGIDLNQL